MFIILVVCTLSQAKAQDIGQHRWQHRLVILLARDANHADLKAQLDVLSADPKGLEERKVFVYSVSPKKYRTGTQVQRWNTGAELYSTLHQKDDFEFLLIGLDGGVKHRQNKIMTLKKLYALIDGMPMRRAEMKKSGK